VAAKACRRCRPIRHDLHDHVIHRLLNYVNSRTVG
jgi:hypothetical protein